MVAFGFWSLVQYFGLIAVIDVWNGDTLLCC